VDAHYKTQANTVKVFVGRKRGVLWSAGGEGGAHLRGALQPRPRWSGSPTQYSHR